MPSITFNDAQKALGHVQKRQMPNGQQWIPDLLKVKGISSWVYHLKSDIRNTFEPEIKQFDDLTKEGRSLIPEDAGKMTFNKDDIQTLDIPEESKERLIDIIDEIDSLMNQEKKVKLTKGKIPEKQIEKHINTIAFEDLIFAINVNGKQQ